MVSRRGLLPFVQAAALAAGLGVISQGCGLDAPVLTFPQTPDGGADGSPGLDSAADASPIPDSGADAGQPCLWEMELVDTATLASPASLALDPSGNPHVAYYAVTGPRATHGWLRHAWLVAGQWQTSDVDGSPGQLGWVGLNPSLALSSAGMPYISYRDATNDLLKLAVFDGSGWQIQTVDARGDRPSLLLDGLDNPMIGYIRHPPGGGAGELMLATWTGASWQLQLLENGGDVRDLSLATDGAGRAHLAYYDHQAGRRGLRYGVWDGVTWMDEPVDDEDPQVLGVGCSLALDSLGRPHISYLDLARQRLKHAARESGLWLVTIVDHIGLPGVTSALALDSMGHPVVAYRPGTGSWIGLGHLQGGTWSSSEVTGASGGRYLDMVLDSTDGTHISFVGEGGDELRYGRCLSEP